MIDITNNRDERHRQLSPSRATCKVNDFMDMTFAAMFALSGSLASGPGSKPEERDSL